MVKHPQTIRREKPTSRLSVFDHFVGLAHKRLNAKLVNPNRRKLYMEISFLAIFYKKVG